MPKPQCETCHVELELVAEDDTTDYLECPQCHQEYFTVSVDI